MNTVDRPEGFKEKRAELTAQRIHSLGADTALETSTATPAPASNQAAKPDGATPSAKLAPATPTAKAKTGKFQTQPEPATATPDFDDIPF
jgi:hypothetical protein